MPALLKVMCDNVLYETELMVIQRLNAFSGPDSNQGITLRMKENFHFIAPSDYDDAATILSENQDDEHFYFIFETCRSNLFQSLATRKNKLLQSKVVDDDATENMSTSTYNPNVLKFEHCTKWSEAELLSFILRLIQICATLQRVNVAHRNIKPANLVFAQSKQKDAKATDMNFDQLLICNFEMATCFQPDSHYSEHRCTQEQECSAIYASPLVQEKVRLIENHSNITIETAVNATTQSSTPSEE